MATKILKDAIAPAPEPKEAERIPGLKCLRCADGDHCGGVWKRCACGCATQPEKPECCHEYYDNGIRVHLCDENDAEGGR